MCVCVPCPVCKVGYEHIPRYHSMVCKRTQKTLELRVELIAAVTVCADSESKQKTGGQRGVDRMRFDRL